MSLVRWSLTLFCIILSSFTHFHLDSDLKYENILFVDDSPGATVKLIDFGLSKTYLGKDKALTDGVGTVRLSHRFCSYHHSFIIGSTTFTP